MVSAGMPELLDPSDITYVRDRLLLHQDDREVLRITSVSRFARAGVFIRTCLCILLPGGEDV